jgi:hypothetical protein
MKWNIEGVMVTRWLFIVVIELVLDLPPARFTSLSFKAGAIEYEHVALALFSALCQLNPRFPRGLPSVCTVYGLLDCLNFECGISSLEQCAIDITSAATLSIVCHRLKTFFFHF